MKLKSLVLCGIALICIQVNVITLSYLADIEVFFSPQSKADIYAQLSSLLDSAENKVLIAMYWLKDEVVLNKLIELKARGIDVQIIFDESTPNAHAHTAAFVRNNIIPIVSPTTIHGIMHNKFVVIDNTSVWTGSANFTPTVLNPTATCSNDENIIIIKSPIAAVQYSNAFYSIEERILASYIHTIAKSESDSDLPDWIISICQLLHQTNGYFTWSLNELLPQFSASQQGKLRSLFPEYQPFAPEPISSREEEATPIQKAFLEGRGFKLNISKREATKLIWEIMASEKAFQ